MTLADLLVHAPLSDAAKDVFRLVLPGELTASAAQLAETIGITERSVFRALAELEGHGLIERESGGGRGKASVLRVKPDAEAQLRKACQSIGRERELPGAEYTPLRDVTLARADRIRQLRLRGLNAQADRLENA